MSSSRTVYTIPDSPTTEAVTPSGGPLSSPLPSSYSIIGTPSNRALPNLPTGAGHHSKPAHLRTGPSQTHPLTRSTAGSSDNNPIDLTSSPPRPSLSLPPLPQPRVDVRSGPVASGTSSSTERSSRRRGSGLVNTAVVPEWQPDHTVKSCPLCHGQFGLFYRKHHCRICGRVVCANCSPHRIIVPSSITVKPPNERPSESFPAQQALQGIANNANLSNRNSWIGSSGAPLMSPALDGPEEVRMCNECLREPPFHNRATMGNSSSSTSSYGLPAGPTTSVGNAQISSTGIPGGGRSSRRRAAPEQSGRSVPPNYQPNGLSFLTQPPSFTAAPYSNSPYGDPTAYYGISAGTNGGIAGAPATSQGNAFSLPLPPSMQTQGTPFPHLYLPRAAGMFVQQTPPARSNSRRRPSHPHGGHLPYPAFQAPLPPIPVQNNSSGAITNPPSARLQQQRPQLKETDYCPICTKVLPPPNPVTGSEADRERHIEQCIGLSMSATIPTPSPTVSTPTSSSVPNTGSARPQVMPRRSTVTKAMGRMSTYKATAKDTHGVDGEQVECVICFEEFEEGDEMAMLDCLCRYHKTCIRQWFDKKGNGNCPVHSSGEN